MRKAALIIEIIQVKATLADTSRYFDIPRWEIERQVDEVRPDAKNALCAKPRDIRERRYRHL